MSAEPETEGTITVWIKHMKAGDPIATHHIWQKYFDRAVRLASRKLTFLHCREADGEDAALSAFVSLYDGAREDRFREFNNRKDLWTLLSVITARKVLDYSVRERAAKRGGGQTASGSALGNDEDGGAGLDAFAGAESDPVVAAIVSEEYHRLLALLPDDGLRQVALWRVEGLTRDEIAERLGCSRRTVANKLELIRLTWMSETLN
jgi:RNA polymerase sigma factor (sigma-70 family)